MVDFDQFPLLGNVPGSTLKKRKPCYEMNSNWFNFWKATGPFRQYEMKIFLVQCPSKSNKYISTVLVVNVMTLQMCKTVWLPAAVIMEIVMRE